MAKKSRFIVYLAVFLALCGCGALDRKDDYETDSARKGRYENGSVVSDHGGILLFGDREDNTQKAANSGIGVNAFLWRAALDTLSFMPITSADPFGGTIITDWYAPPSTPNERVKLNVYIMGRELRADGLRVNVFKQQRTATGWVDAQTNVATAGSVEDSILTRARQLRVRQLGQSQN